MQQTATTALDIGTMLTGFGGGLALFLFGMRQMTEALKTVAGEGMKTLLGLLTANRFKGLLAGAVVTAVVQSSSVTTVLVVGFLTAGLITFPQSIGVIIGANIGTTVTAQIVAFRIYEYGLLMIAVGFLMETTARRSQQRQYGLALMGLGLIFFGMELMTGATGPLRGYTPFIEAMGSLENPVLGALAGFAFTAAIHSSSATTGLVIVLAGEGLITLESGVALVMGANVGTCVTAVFSAMGRPREAVQAAAVHVLFNVLGVAVWLLFVPQLAGFVRAVAPTDTARQIAHAHTLFNVSTALMFIWFTTPLARVVERIVPAIVTAPEKGKPIYLDDYFISQPPLALDRVRMELGRLAALVGEMLHGALPAVLSAPMGRIVRLEQADEEVNALHGAIVLYLGRISQQNLVDAQARHAYEHILTANYLENMGDVVDNNLMEAARKRRDRGIVISESTRQRLRHLHEKVCLAFDQVARAIESGDSGLAQTAIDSKADINETADRIMAHLAERLVAHEPNRLASFQVEADTVENLERLNNLTRRIARVLLRSPATRPEEAESPSSQRGA